MSNNNSKATENELGELHNVIARTLREKIENGTATSADISNAIKFLKDNNISCDMRDCIDLGYIAEEVPKFNLVDNDYETNEQQFNVVNFQK